MRKQMFIFGFALICAAVLFTACQKEEQPNIPNKEEALPAPDSIQDLVGYFSPYHEIFFIDPAYMERILAFVGATPTTDGRFGVQLEMENGEIMDYFFWVEHIPAPELYFQAQALEEAPVLDSQEEGKWKLYKNAICPEKANNKKQDSDCETVNNDAGGAMSKKTVISPYKTCIYNANENNLCREVMGKIGVTTFYENLRCRGDKIREEDYNAFHCGK